MIKYKISVIIPVYNDEKYLPKTLDSLLRQTIGFNNLQVIFVDDFSTDSSPEIIKQYASVYSNIVAIYSKKNSGTGGKPRNIGMKHAVADYYIFLDGDDWLEDTACEILFEEIVRKNVDLVSGYHSIVNEDGTTVTHKTPQYQDIASIDFSLPDELDNAFKLRSHFSNKIYRKRIIEEKKISFTEGEMGEDLIFFTQYLLSCRSFKYIDQQIIYYRQRKQEYALAVTNHSIKYFQAVNKFFKQMSVLVGRERKDSLFRILVAETFHVIILNLIDSQQISEAEIILALRSFRWVFDYCSKQNMFKDLFYVVSLSEAVMANNYAHALHIILAIRLFRFESLQTLAGNAWLEEQLNNHKRALDNLILVNKTLSENL